VGTALRDRVFVGDPATPDAPVVLATRTSRDRITRAALRCLARFGLSKTTVDDVAREARLSRATLYRNFPGGRDEVIAAVVAEEIRAYFATLDRALSGLENPDDLEEILVTVLVVGADGIAGHAALRTLLAHEPEVLLPHVSFRGFDGVLDVAADHLRPYLEPRLGAVQARRVAEWMTRLVVSHVLSPPGAAPRSSIPGMRRSEDDAPFALHPEPLGDARARRLVRQFVMPGIHVLTSASAAAGNSTNQQGEVSSWH
jgi:AcrR family transcriptional regulator